MRNELYLASPTPTLLFIRHVTTFSTKNKYFHTYKNKSSWILYVQKNLIIYTVLIVLINQLETEKHTYDILYLIIIQDTRLKT